jgi:class 3 adenylate cyclase/pimeloyl-ACP methyl ester carboxylesterase
MEREVRYCTTEDGVRIAYRVEGDGPPVLVCPGFVESFSLDHLDRSQATFMALLGHGRSLIRFDMRGTGLSQRENVDLSPAALVRDLDAVVRATRIRQCYVWASTLSGPRALQYAAEHPRRVLGMILFGTYARANDVMPSNAIRGMAHFVRTSPDFALSAIIGGSTVIGDEAANAEAAARQAEAYKKSADPGVVADMLAAGADTDASEALRRIRCPVLVLHRTGDTVVPFAVGRTLASHIRNATFVPLQGDAHSYAFGDQQAIFDAVDRFLPPAGDHDQQPAPRPGASTFRAVLFTDLVGHTEMMSRLGDERGRDVLREHERITRGVLKANGGTEVKTMGDGFMASFGSVTKAVQCAIALQRAFAEREGEPLAVRVGLNAGEPIEEDGDLFGATVILASRIAAKAEGGEILVADTVRGLCSGKGFLFADPEEFVAKGFEEPVRVFEVSWRG